MNEQVRRLMEQAVTSIDGQTFGKTYIPDEFTEKFVKLVIEKCCEQLEKEQYEHFDINRVPRTFYNAALYDGIVAIKKHFGVSNE